MPTTHLINGVTNVPDTQTLGSYVALDPAVTHEFFTDFDVYTASNWTVTSVGSATQALTSGDGGLLLVTNAGADDNSCAFQLVAPGFTFEAGRQAWFKARFKISDAIESDFTMGLYLLDTTPIVSAPADGVYFAKTDGSAAINLVMAKTSASTNSTAIGTAVSDTYMVLGFYYDGNDQLTAFKDGVAVAQPTTLANLPTVPLSVSFAIQNGEAVAKSMTVDYIFAAKKRTSAN